MSQDIRETPPPPEAQAIRLARMAGRLSVDDAVAKVRTAGGQIGATYWRDVERGHGGRRGKRVLARASEGLLAQMARAVSLTPEQLREAADGHPDGEERARVVRRAAQVLEEMQRRDERPPLAVVPEPPPRLFRVDPAHQKDMDRYEPGILRMVVRAQQEYPGQPLTGDMVFDPQAWDGPERDRARYAALWDQIAGIEPVPLRTVQLLATVLAWEDQAAHEQGGAASGLALAGRA